MYSKNLSSFLWYGFALVIITLLTFGLLHWLHVPSGRMIDWMIGVLSFWWLLIISTIPWNTYFEARAVIAESMESERAAIRLEPDQIAYVNLVSKRSLKVAISLHLLSAITMFALSATGISPVGYVASTAALLLTVLRPAVRAYEYLWQRLALIRHQIRFPREDVSLLERRVSALESEIKALNFQLDDSQIGCYAHVQKQAMLEVNQSLQKLTTAYEQLSHQNRIDHAQLAREAQSSIAKISADTQFLDHVREIVRMVKTA